MIEERLAKDLTFRVHHTMLPVADLERSIAFHAPARYESERAHASEARKVEVGLMATATKRRRFWS